MKAKVLRQAVSMAKENGKAGLFIWASRRTWEQYSHEYIPGDPQYEETMQIIMQGKEAEVSVHLSNYDRLGFMAVPLKKMKNPGYFWRIRQMCQTYEGPIEAVPRAK